MTTGIISALPNHTIASVEWAATPELSLVVPIFNEQENIALLHERVSAVLRLIGRSYEIIAVDDGSSDRSFAILRELAGHD